MKVHISRLDLSSAAAMMVRVVAAVLTAINTVISMTLTAKVKSVEGFSRTFSSCLM